MSKKRDPHEPIRRFYDETYYRDVRPLSRPTGHLRRLAKKLSVARADEVLDVACGAGSWLLACKERGARVSGIDLSARAIEVCKQAMPDGDFHCGPAENLPFDSGKYDLVTCLGSLEHFIAPEDALKEMIRVSKRDARLVLLVPNANFLTRRLGLYRGTSQTAAREDVRSLTAWRNMFESCGLEVVSRWKDLHVLSWDWIKASRWYVTPVRAAQALALPIWPLDWQYQVYHLCRPSAP